MACTVKFSEWVVWYWKIEEFGEQIVFVYIIRWILRERGFVVIIVD